MSDARPSFSSRWPTLLLVCAAQFMVILDVSVVNVALPAIRGDLGFSEANLQWVVNAYTLTFAGFLLLGGRASDLLGRRRVFVFGLLLFTGASLVGGFAHSEGTLIAARAAQGVGGAVVSPSTLAILTTTFTEGGDRNRALGIWGAMGGAGGAAGVLLGGILTQALSWRWILFINVPIGIAAALLALRQVAEGRAAAGPKRSADIAGALTVTAGLFALVFGIVRSEAAGWTSWQMLVPAGAGLALIAAFIVIEARVARDPLMPLRIFASRMLTGANLVVFLLGSAMFGMWFFVSLYLQQVLGYSPLKAGLAFLPMTAAIVIGATFASRAVARAGVRPLLAVGMLCQAAGLYLFSQVSASGSYLGDVLAAGLLVAIGIGLSFVPVTIAAVAGVEPHEAGLASGLVNTSRQVGGALGLAILATLATSRTADALAGHHGAAAVHVALTDGFQRAFGLAALFSLAGAIIALLALRTPRQARGRERERELADAAA